MKKKRTYGSVDVEKIDPLAIVKMVLTIGCIVAVDVAKTKFVAAIADAAGEVLRILRFEHPRQTLAFLRIVEALHVAKLVPRVVMEPTGTYGDALRYQCHARNVRIEMMSPKHTHDIAEVLDGVPSMHDPKAAVALARLAVLRPGRAWQPDTEEKREVRALLDRRWPMSKTHELYHGHLEAMLASCWPELGSLLDVREQRSWMALLERYPGPHLVAASREEAAATLRKASRGRLARECIAAVVDSASTTLGVPMMKGEEVRLRFIVEQIERETRGLDAVDAEISGRVAKDAMMSRLAVTVGPACAASMLSHVGSPLAFERPSGLEKAIGINLKEKSSGEQRGNVHITKRGPAQVRQLLYLATLRLVQSDPIVAAWYRARTSYTSKSKQKAIVAVMRKLVRALWYVARGSAFDASKLFDVRRLNVTRDANKTTPDTAPAATGSPPAPVPAASLPKQRNQGGAPQPHA
jgi:transposase